MKRLIISVVILACTQIAQPQDLDEYQIVLCPMGGWMHFATSEGEVANVYPAPEKTVLYLSGVTPSVRQVGDDVWAVTFERKP